MNQREEVIYKIAKKEIQRILLSESAWPTIDRQYTLEEVALAKLCQEGAITYEEFVKQRIVYENGIIHHARRL